MNDKPELLIWQARSTYAVLVAIVFSVLDSLGVVPPAELSPEALTDFVYASVPVVGVLWAAWERRNPKYKLVVRKSNGLL